MELLKKNIHTERIKSKALLQIPLETDINVPDAKPDVAKVIYDCGTIKVDEIKTGMNKIWVKGKLCYQLLYQTDGEEKAFAGMDGEIPFMEEIYLDKLEGTDRVVCRSTLDDMRIHIINSRKLSIQSVISLEPRVEESISEELCVELDSAGEADQKLEYRKKSLDFLETIVKKRDLLRIHEEARLPSGMPEIGAALWKNASISSISFRPMDEKLGITGELNIFVVYREDTSGRVNWYETVIPFNGTVECQNSREGMIADVLYDIGHEEIAVREDADGEFRVIGIEMTVELEIKLYEKESTSIVADVYGVSCEVQADIDSRQFRDLCMELDIEEKLTRSVRLEDADPKILQVCHSDARARLAEIAWKDGQLRLTGEIDLQVLYAANESESGLCPVRSSVPFEIVRDIPDVDEGQLDQNSVSVWIPQQAVSIKDSAQFEWRGSIHVRILMYSVKNEEILTDLKVEPINADVLEKLPGFAIYYVRPGDSLWQIGKRYYVSVGRIKEMNNLTEDEIKPGDKILIVK
ncbi:MAG: DUF3794 domain-containing protein [Lachnospiraceae bacterium]|nr:DUF3794 domain-containing protein [Lachnospiraceae bacterium]